tara:strand:+ start:125 stop:490 length:366 start_codon:yes stop_codon:yes gene_type:complete
MGLDQFAGRHTWRKHARLQQFMSVMHREQNPNIKEYDSSGIPSLGFNGGDVPVKMTKEVVEKLEKAINDGYYDYFATDGFFWGQQFQEEAAKEYKEQDLEFLADCKKALENNDPITYECSW